MPRARRGGKGETFFTRIRQIEKPGELTRTPRDERIIKSIVAICRSQLSDNTWADELISSLIERLWMIGGFHWEMGAIKSYVFGAIRLEWIRLRDQKTTALSQFDLGDNEFLDDASKLDLLAFVGHRQQASQEKHIEAIEALALVAALPADQRQCLMILVDGGSPIDVAKDMGIEPWDAIRLIKDARVNIHRVDRDEETWQQRAA